MTTALKVLGQVKPSAASLTPLYTATAVTTVVSSIVICNQSSTPTTFRVAIRGNGGDTIDTKHYIYYDMLIAGNDTFVITGGITLQASDVIEVYATLATLSFSAFGQENS
jgi:hypothetical protein